MRFVSVSFHFGFCFSKRKRKQKAKMKRKRKMTLVMAFAKIAKKTSNFGWGALPPRPPDFWLGGFAPRDLPLNGRPQHLIEAAKRGRLDQMIFFSAPLSTRAPPTTVQRASDDRPPAVRQPSTVPMILRYLLKFSAWASGFGLFWAPGLLVLVDSKEHLA